MTTEAPVNVVAVVRQQAQVTAAIASQPRPAVVKVSIPGAPGKDGITAEAAEEIATAEATEMRVDCDALVAALLFQH